MLGYGVGAAVEVTVRDARGAGYTVPAVVMPAGQDTPTYSVMCSAAKGTMTHRHHVDQPLSARLHQRHRSAVPRGLSG